MTKTFLVATLCFFSLTTIALAAEVGHTVHGITYGPAKDYDRSKDTDPSESLKDLRAAMYSKKCSDRVDGTDLLGNVLHRRRDRTFEINRTFYMDGDIKITSTIKSLNVLPKAQGDTETAYQVDYIDTEKKPAHGFFVLAADGSVTKFAVQKVGDSFVDDCPIDTNATATAAIIKTCQGKHPDWMKQSWWIHASPTERRYVCEKNFSHVL